MLGFDATFNSLLEERVTKPEWDTIMHSLNSGFAQRRGCLVNLCISMPPCR